MTPPPPPADTGVVRTVMDDVQSRQDERRLAIDKVGIRGLAHPVQVHDRSQALQHTVAHFSMAVALPQHLNGTHMSRFVEILHRERVIGVTTLGALLQDTIDKLEADAAHIDI